MSPPTNQVPEYTVRFVTIIGIICVIHALIRQSLSQAAGITATILASISAYFLANFINANLFPLGPEMITAAVCFPPLVATWIVTQ